jgi:AraC-like DNA-binding protein
MDRYRFIMYYNKIMIKKIKILKPDDVYPEILHSNYFKLRSAEQSWGPRIVSEYELIYIVAGVFSYQETAKEKVYVNEGDILTIPPGEKHIFKCEKKPLYGAVISCIHLELLPHHSRLKKEYRPLDEPPLITPVKGDYVLHQLFRNTRSTFEGYTPYREAILKNIAREIWLRMAEYWQGENSSGYSYRVKEMLEFIQSKIPAEVTRKDLADKFALTPEHINFIFKRETGMTPTQAIHRARINLACRYLLEDGLCIKETAEKVGFCDEFYFSKVFKKIMKVSPGKMLGR